MIFSISYMLLNITSERKIFTKNFTRFGIDIKDIKPTKILEIDIDKNLDKLDIQKFHIYKYKVSDDIFKNIKSQVVNNKDLIFYSESEFKNKDLFQSFNKLLLLKDSGEWNFIFKNSPMFYTLFLSNESSYYYNLMILLKNKNIIYFVN